MNDMSRGIGNHLRGDHRKERTATCRVCQCVFLFNRPCIDAVEFTLRSLLTLLRQRCALPRCARKLLNFCAYEDECGFTQCTHIFHYG
jgi:hypothetical protein